MNKKSFEILNNIRSDDIGLIRQILPRFNIRNEEDFDKFIHKPGVLESFVKFFDKTKAAHENYMKKEINIKIKSEMNFLEKKILEKQERLKKQLRLNELMKERMEKKLCNMKGFQDMKMGSVREKVIVIDDENEQKFQNNNSIFDQRKTNTNFGNAYPIQQEFVPKEQFLKNSINVSQQKVEEKPNQQFVQKKDKTLVFKIIGENNLLNTGTNKVETLKSTQFTEEVVEIEGNPMDCIVFDKVKEKKEETVEVVEKKTEVKEISKEKEKEKIEIIKEKIEIIKEKPEFISKIIKEQEKKKQKPVLDPKNIKENKFFELIRRNKIDEVKKIIENEEFKKNFKSFSKRRKRMFLNTCLMNQYQYFEMFELILNIYEIELFRNNQFLMEKVRKYPRSIEIFKKWYKKRFDENEDEKYIYIKE